MNAIAINVMKDFIVYSKLCIYASLEIYDDGYNNKKLQQYFKK